MSDAVGMKRVGFTFIWKIENFSLVPKLSKCGVICSPSFTADNLDESTWQLRLYPPGFHFKNCDTFDFCLSKYSDSKPNSITLDYELSIITKSDLKENCVRASKFVFDQWGFYGTPLCLTPLEIFNKKEILPGDTLTVLCKMWHHEKQCLIHGFGLARTRIGSERKSFIWTIDKFSSLKVNDKKSLSVKLPSNSNLSFVITLYLTGTPTFDEKIRIKVEGNNEVALDYLVMLGISVLKVNGEAVYHFEENFKLSGKKEWPFPLIMEKKQLSSNKDLLLPDDILSLKCVLVVSKFEIPDSIVLNEVESTSYGVDAVSDLEAAVTNATESPCQRNEEYSISNSLKSDMKRLFDSKYLADINFQVRDEVFPAHKAILAARSSVFNTMFNTDMKEKFTNIIEIEDFEPDIIRRLLLYIYSDTLDSDMDWKNASNLCLAAEKYSVVGLKEKCSSFLKMHLNITNVCETLFLADSLVDEDLKNYVLSFIEEYDEDIMNSNAWNDFKQKHPQLTIEILSRLYRNVKKF